VLAELGIDHTVRAHSELDRPIAGPSDFADALGYEPGRITKTLLTAAQSGNRFVVVVCPAPAPVDFRRVAAAAGTPRLELASSERLAAITDYPRAGVSPLGLPPDIAIVVDRALLDYPTVLIGGGVAAVEIEIAPAELVAATHAIVATVTKSSP
jgi:Cys-tRNA(Pro)/Cys-tRNA(Cys) deacylase